MSNIDFELVLKSVVSLPMVRIDRRAFLKSELIKYCSKDQVLDAIENNPAHAGIPVSVINKIAGDRFKVCVNSKN